MTPTQPPGPPNLPQLRADLLAIADDHPILGQLATKRAHTQGKPGPAAERDPIRFHAFELMCAIDEWVAVLWDAWWEVSAQNQTPLTRDTPTLLRWLADRVSTLTAWRPTRDPEPADDTWPRWVCWSATQWHADTSKLIDPPNTRRLIVPDATCGLMAPCPGKLCAIVHPDHDLPSEIRCSTGNPDHTRPAGQWMLLGAAIQQQRAEASA